MSTQFKSKGLNFEYQLRSIKDFDYQLFLKSSKPEEVVFAVLSNFGEDIPKIAIEKIIDRLEETTENELSLKKYINQLRVLAELRKLDLQIDEIMESISKYLNEENDYFVVKAKRKIVENLLKETDMALDKIAKIAGVTIDFVVNIQQKLSPEK